MGHSIGGGVTHAGGTSQCGVRHSIQQSIWVGFFNYKKNNFCNYISNICTHIPALRFSKRRGTNYQKLATLNFIICKIHVNNMKIGNHFKQSHSMSNSYLHEKFILIFKFILKFKRNTVLKFYLYFYYTTR